MDAFVQELINGLEKREVIIFCGAGISFNSGIPVVWDIKSKILDCLNLSSAERKLILDFPQPFEAFIETVIEKTAPNSLFQIFESGKPNTTHRFLAKLAKNHFINTIVTTNFDTLIESSMEEESVDFDLIYEDDLLHGLKLDDGRTKVIKLHGSIHDQNGMALTIRQVANNDSVYSRKKAISEIVTSQEHKSILVIGYSCSDVFDICPSFSCGSLDKNKRIFYLNHSTKIGTHSDSENDITLKSLPSPFQGYPGGTKTSCTDTVIKKVWQSILVCPYPSFVKLKAPWEQAIEMWINTAIAEYGENILDFLSGSLLKYSANFEASNEYFLKVINTGEEDDTA